MALSSDAGEATKRFGELAVDNGFATPSEVELALEAQKQTEQADLNQAARLGQILLDMGTLTPEQVEAVLLAQARLRRAQSEPVLDAETDTKIVVQKAHTQAAQSMAAEPSGWLILETDGRSSSAYPLWEKALLGRAPTHEVPVPDMLSSREHARIEFADGGHVLTDLASRNGTYVNEERTEGPCPLKAGDRIRIGTTVYRYAPGIKVASAAAEPPAPSQSETVPIEPATDGSLPPEPEPPVISQSETVPIEPAPEPVPDPPPNAVSVDDSSTTITPIKRATPPPEEEEKSPEASEKRPQLEEAKKVARIAGRGILAALRGIDRLVAKIPPRIHNQRKYVTFGCALGILAVFMPWFHNKPELGIATGTGWLTLLMFAATLALVLIKAGPRPVEFRLLLAVVALPLLAGLFAFLDPMPKESAVTGLGWWVTIVVGLLTSVLAFFTREKTEPAPQPAGTSEAPAAAETAPGDEPKGVFKKLVGGFFEKTKRLARDVSGKRAKEKARAVERRDALLTEIAEAAAGANLEDPEADAVAEAAEALKAVEGQERSGSAKATVQHKQKLKAAEGKLHRARLKLARVVIDRGLAVEGIQEKVDEIKALDAQVKELS